VQLDYGGVVRLGFVSDDGYVNLYEDGFLDHAANPTTGVVTLLSVSDKLVTRGYTAGTAGFKRAITARLSLATWWPSLTVKARTEGVAEETVLVSNKTRSRTAYMRPWNATPWDATNANNDHSTAWREDYSVAQSGGAAIDPGANGLDPERHQEIDLTVKAKGTGRLAQIVVENTQGRCIVRSVETGLRAGSRRLGVQA
jgi:hypothetical protein